MTHDRTCDMDPCRGFEVLTSLKPVASVERDPWIQRLTTQTFRASMSVAVAVNACHVPAHAAFARSSGGCQMISAEDSALLKNPCDQ